MSTRRQPARAAVFLDRDDTLVEDAGYLHQRELVVLLPGVREGLTALWRAGWPLVVVSNQSGIGRGYFGPEDFHSVMGRIVELVGEPGFRFTGLFYCPHHPDVTGPCECRKPGVALFERAARELGLDLSRSWFLGDRVWDVEPASRFGGRGLLVAAGARGEEAERAAALGFQVAPDLRAAAALIERPGARGNDEGGGNPR